MKTRISVITSIEVEIPDNVTDEYDQYWESVNEAERRIKQVPGVIEVNDYARDIFWIVQEK